MWTYEIQEYLCVSSLPWVEGADTDLGLGFSVSSFCRCKNFGVLDLTATSETSYTAWRMYFEVNHDVDLQDPCDNLLLITIAGDGMGYRRALGFGILRRDGCRRIEMVVRRSAGY